MQGWNSFVLFPSWIENAKLPSKISRKKFYRETNFSFVIVLPHVKCSYTLQMKTQSMFNTAHRHQLEENHHLGDEQSGIRVYSVLICLACDKIQWAEARIETQGNSAWEPGCLGEGSFDPFVTQQATKSQCDYWGSPSGFSPLRLFLKIELFILRSPPRCWKKKDYLGVLELRYERAALHIKEPLITNIQMYCSSLKFPVEKKHL